MKLQRLLHSTGPGKKILMKVVMHCLFLDWISLAPLLQLLFFFIAFGCFGFLPVLVVSLLLKMAEHTRGGGGGLKRGFDRLLVMGSLTAMVTWHYLGSITFLLISLFIKLAISLLTTVRMHSNNAIGKNLLKVVFFSVLADCRSYFPQVTLGSLVHRLYLKWRKMYPPPTSSRAPRKSARASTSTLMLKGTYD